MAIPFARAHCQEQAGHELAAVVDPSLEVLIQRAGLPMETWAFSKFQRRDLYRRLRERRPGQATFLTNSAGSFWPYVLAAVPRRRGFKRGAASLLLSERVHHDAGLPQGLRNLALLDTPRAGGKVSGSPASNPPLIRPALERGAPPTLLLFPGANYGPAKSWSITAYAGIVRRAARAGWSVVLLGTARDRAQAGEILALAGAAGAHNECGTHPLPALLDWLENRPNCVGLANDSGALHLLAACGIPVLGLYFSTSTQNTPPAFGPATLFSAEIPCSPCFKRECPYGHYDCRGRIGEDAVWTRLSGLAAGLTFGQ